MFYGVAAADPGLAPADPGLAPEGPASALAGLGLAPDLGASEEGEGELGHKPVLGGRGCCEGEGQAAVGVHGLHLPASRPQDRRSSWRNIQVSKVEQV